MRIAVRALEWIGVGVLVGLLILIARPTAHALPEYAARTGQPCAVCHVNPAGGGPRTERGALWVAQGKPDEVPALPTAEGEQESAAAPEGRALYTKYGCAGCHGPEGEGGLGPALNQPGVTADAITQTVRNGQGNMMAFDADALSDAELETIVQVVLALGRGEAEPGPVPGTRPLPPAQPGCQEKSDGARRLDCGGN